MSACEENTLYKMEEDMELRKKWKSRSGASILIALLFFLVSIMVSSSILMAAVSNAGKLNRNRQALGSVDGRYI